MGWEVKEDEMNIVTIIGRLTRDADIRQITNGKMAAFTVAVDRNKDGGADFIRVIAFGKTAEIVEKYTGKGKQVGVSGRIQTGEYEKDGHKVKTTDVVADRVELLGGKNSEDQAHAEQPVDMSDIPF